MDHPVWAAVTTGVLLLALWASGRLVYYLGLAPLAGALGQLGGPGRWLGYLLLLPGTVLHECSHAAACLLTGTRIRRFVPFSPQPDGTLGWIEHDSVGPVRSALIGLAPVLGGVAALTLLARLLLPDLPAASVAWVEPAVALWALPGWAWRLVQAADPVRPTAWFFAYLALSIGRATSPSLPDLRQVAGVWAVCAGVLFLAAAGSRVIGLAPELGQSDAAKMGVGLISQANGALAFAVVLILAAAIPLAPLALLVKAIRRSRPRAANRLTRQASRRT